MTTPSRWLEGKSCRTSDGKAEITEKLTAALAFK